MTLETEGLLLRPHVAADAEALEAILGNPVAMEFYPAPLDQHGMGTLLTKTQQPAIPPQPGKVPAQTA